MRNHEVKGLALATIYVDDYQVNLVFYRDVVGLPNMQVMNDHSCYFQLGNDQGVYLVGGFALANRSERQTGTSFAFDVSDIDACYQSISDSGSRMLHEAPVQMNDDTFWFQCSDPGQNIIEFLGPRVTKKI